MLLHKSLVKSFIVNRFVWPKMENNYFSFVHIHVYYHKEHK